MHPARTLLVMLAAFAVGGCGSGEPSTPTAADAPSTAGICTEVVREGATVTDALIDQGCTDQNDAKRIGKVKTCKNGQRLWEMDGLIGLSGKPMLAEGADSGNGVTARALNEMACKL